MSKKCVFVPISDSHYYPEGTHIFVNSFRRFHPDVDVVVFRQDVIDQLFAGKKLNWGNAKPFFAELLEDKYDLIVNMDGDHVVTGRMSEVFDNIDYDVAFPWNFNDYENAGFANITEEMYLQAGMVASISKAFWQTWRESNRESHKYVRRENDIVNLVVYNQMPELKLKIVDKEKDYYGCKSLGREPEFYIEDDKLLCRGEQVLAYHFARGNVFPKLDFDNMPFRDDVKEWLKRLSFGQSYKMTTI